MPAWLPLAAVMGASVALVLAGEKTGRRALRFAFKPVASAAFVALAWSGNAPPNPYGAWILAGMALCLVGDVLLMLDGGLRPGLVAFLLGHVAYVAAFHALAPARSWPLALAAPVVVASALVARVLWAHLGPMRAPVLAYIAVITVMVWGAASVLAVGVAGWQVPAGALLFYLSDIAVARERFVRKAFVNRAWGLPAYYLGQLLLAISVAR